MRRARRRKNNRGRVGERSANAAAQNERYKRNPEIMKKIAGPISRRATSGAYHSPRFPNSDPLTNPTCSRIALITAIARRPSRHGKSNARPACELAAPSGGAVGAVGEVGGDSGSRCVVVV